MNALKTLLFTIVAPGTVTILVPRLLLASDSTHQTIELGVLQLLGLIPIVVGAWFYVRCAWDFVATGRGTPAPIDPPKTLMVRGLYRSVRNPMYVGVILLLCGEAIFFESASVLAYALLIFLLFHTFVIFYEEPTLRRMFGLSYQEYCRTVPRWVPRIGRNPAGVG